MLGDVILAYHPQYPLQAEHYPLQAGSTGTCTAASTTSQCVASPSTHRSECERQQHQRYRQHRGGRGRLGVSAKSSQLLHPGYRAADTAAGTNLLHLGRDACATCANRAWPAAAVARRLAGALLTRRSAAVGAAAGGVRLHFPRPAAAGRWLQAARPGAGAGLQPEPGAGPGLHVWAGRQHGVGATVLGAEATIYLFI